jgi:hypothetical protein
LVVGRDDVVVVQQVALAVHGPGILAMPVVVGELVSSVAG